MMGGMTRFLVKVHSFLSSRAWILRYMKQEIAVITNYQSISTVFLHRVEGRNNYNRYSNKTLDLFLVIKWNGYDNVKGGQPSINCRGLRTIHICLLVESEFNKGDKLTFFLSTDNGSSKFLVIYGLWKKRSRWVPEEMKKSRRFPSQFLSCCERFLFFQDGKTKRNLSERVIHTILEDF